MVVWFIAPRVIDGRVELPDAFGRFNRDSLLRRLEIAKSAQPTVQDNIGLPGLELVTQFGHLPVGIIIWRPFTIKPQDIDLSIVGAEFTQLRFVKSEIALPGGCIRTQF